MRVDGVRVQRTPLFRYARHVGRRTYIEREVQRRRRDRRNSRGRGGVACVRSAARAAEPFVPFVSACSIRRRQAWCSKARTGAKECRRLLEPCEMVRRGAQGSEVIPTLLSDYDGPSAENLNGGKKLKNVHQTGYGDRGAATRLSVSSVSRGAREREDVPMTLRATLTDRRAIATSCRRWQRSSACDTTDCTKPRRTGSQRLGSAHPVACGLSFSDHCGSRL